MGKARRIKARWIEAGSLVQALPVGALMESTIATDGHLWLVSTVHAHRGGVQARSLATGAGAIFYEGEYELATDGG